MTNQQGVIVAKRKYSLWQQNKGVAALEFAIVAPLFFLMLFLGLELGLMAMADAALDRTTSKISRMGRIGIVEADCLAAIRREMIHELSPWADHSSLHIDVQIYEPDVVFSDVNDPDYRPSCVAGGPGALMVYRLGFKSTGFVGILGLLGWDAFTYQRTVVVQNEP